MPATPPPLPISVDSETGIWTTDGMPMIYLPRHFHVNHHVAIEAALGRERYAQILYEAGYKSAWEWCEKESVTHKLRGLDVVRHYIRRISQRGWGQFSLDDVDETTGQGTVGLMHSVYVEGQPQSTGTSLCYPFAGWFAGALEWAAKDLGHTWSLRSAEVECAGDHSHSRCSFAIRAQAPQRPAR